MENKTIDKLIEYAETVFGVSIIVDESSDYDTFDEIIGELPKE